MKTSAPTLLFYAAATFLLGAIAYAVLSPLVDSEQLLGELSGSRGLGLNAWLRLLALAIAAIGPIMFGVAAFSGRERSAGDMLWRAGGAIAIVVAIVAAGVFLATNAVH